MAKECNLSFCLNELPLIVNELPLVEDFIVWPSCTGPEESKSVTVNEFLETKIVWEVSKNEY